MERTSRNYLIYTLASFVIFFNVLLCARAIFTANLSVFLYICYIALLLGLFVAWRAKEFEKKALGYGFLFSVLMLLVNFINHGSQTFWLVFWINLVILAGLIALALAFRTREPSIQPLEFGLPPPRIDQDLAKRFREKLKINAADRVLLLYGKPERAKQFSLLLEALPIITNLCSNLAIRLLITTWGESDGETPRLKTLAKELNLLDSLRFIKTTDPENLKYIINLADIIVFPYAERATDISDLNAVLPYLKSLVVPDYPLFAQLVNEKTCLKVKNISDKKELALTVERLIKDEKLMLQLGFNLSKPID